MKLGVMSDSHGNATAIHQGLEIFLEHEVKMVLHAGDIIDASHVRFFEKFILHIVKGNGDSLEELEYYTMRYNQPDPSSFKLLTFSDKTVYLYHGDRNSNFNEARKNEYNYIIRGHKHTVEDYMAGKSRILNPGALYRASKYTVGILNVEYDDWKIMTL